MLHPIQSNSRVMELATPAVVVDVGTRTAAATEEVSPAETAILQLKQAIWQQYQHVLDKTTPHVLPRWIGFSIVTFIYILRVYFLEGFYVVTYALGICILDLVIGFLSPQVDPAIANAADGPTLPIRA